MGDTLSVRESELAVERERVAVRYARLDALRREKQEQLAAETRDEPLKRVPAEHHWTPNELIILRTLLNAVDVTRENSAYDAMMWYVVGKVFPREKRVSDDTLMETIRALGVLSPSLNPALLAPSLRLPLNPEAREAAVQKDDALLECALKRAPVQTPLGPEDFHAVDPFRGRATRLGRYAGVRRRRRGRARTR